MTNSEDTAGHSSHRKLLDRTFYVSLILKGINGLLELLGGTLLVLVDPTRIKALVGALTQQELSEDPQDFIARSLVNLSKDLDVSTTLFVAIYLLIHGLVKAVLVWAVLRDRLWAYPWLIAFLVAFILYQIYELSIGFGWGLFALTAFDVFIVALTWREYRLHRPLETRFAE